MQSVKIDGRFFSFFPLGKRAHRKAKVIIGDFVLWDVEDDEIGQRTVVIGFCHDMEEAKEKIKNYFRFSFCVASDNPGSYPWCIRELVSRKRRESIDTPSLCNETTKGRDLIAPVNLRHRHVCEECARIYRIINDAAS